MPVCITHCTTCFPQVIREQWILEQHSRPEMLNCKKRKEQISANKKLFFRHLMFWYSTHNEHLNSVKQSFSNLSEWQVLTTKNEHNSDLMRASEEVLYALFAPNLCREDKCCRILCHSYFSLYSKLLVLNRLQTRG